MLVFLHPQSCCLFSSLLFQSCSCLVLLCCCSLPRWSVVSAVLTFSASLSVLAPLAPIQFPVLNQSVEALSMLCFFLLLHSCEVQCFQRCVDLQCLTQRARSLNTDPVNWLFYYIVLAVPMYGMILLLITFQMKCCQCCVDLQRLAQCTCSFFSDAAHFLSFVSTLLQCLTCCLIASHPINTVLSMLCWPSMPHSVRTLLHCQSHCLCVAIMASTFFPFNVLILRLKFSVVSGTWINNIDATAFAPSVPQCLSVQRCGC